MKAFLAFNVVFNKGVIEKYCKETVIELGISLIVEVFLFFTWFSTRNEYEIMQGNVIRIRHLSDF